MKMQCERCGEGRKQVYGTHHGCFCMACIIKDLEERAEAERASARGGMGVHRNGPCGCPMLVGGGIDHEPGCSKL